MNRCLAIIFIVAMSACSQPVSVESFVPVSRRDAMGRFCFSVDMTDSLSAYSVSLLASFACRDRRFSSFVSMPFSVVWEAPDGKMYEESIEIGRNGIREESYDKKIIYSPYRRNLKPDENGIWKLYMKTPEDSLVKYKLYGMGIRVRKEEKEKTDGTR